MQLQPPDIRTASPDIMTKEHRNAVLTALRVMNKKAKDYRDAASHDYENGYKAAAHKHSVRKQALYDFKSAILRDLVARGAVDTIELHDDGQTELYYFEFKEVNDTVSFHTPVDEWTGQDMDVTGAQSVELEDTGVDQSHWAAPDEPLSEQTDPVQRVNRAAWRNAAAQLTSVYHSPNLYVGAKFNSEYYSHDFLGWDWLPDSLTVGSIIDQTGFIVTNSEYRTKEEHLFSPPLTVDTVESGTVELTDTVHILEEGEFSDHVGIELAYQVVVGDDDSTSRVISERDLIEKWKILLPSTSRDKIEAEIGEKPLARVPDSVFASPEVQAGTEVELAEPDGGVVRATVQEVVYDTIGPFVDLTLSDSDKSGSIYRRIDEFEIAETNEND